MRIGSLLAATVLAVVSVSSSAGASYGTFRGSDYLTDIVELRYSLGATPGTNELRASGAGIYNDNGNHYPSITSYVAGQGGTTSVADFLIFDLGEISGQITSASLVLQQPTDGYLGPPTGLRYTLYDVSTPISTLVAPQSGAYDIFDDLLSGSTFGSTLIRPDSVGSLVNVSFNAAGLAALNAHEGGDFAVGGGAVVSLVPLPASAPMFGAALLALAALGYGVRRKRAAGMACPPAAAA